MTRHPSTLLLGLALALGSCGGDDAQEDRPLVVSAIGAPVQPGDAATPRDTPSRLLVGATAQGLVRFDPAGGIEPALAETWSVAPDGTSYIFRLREAEWANGEPVTAGEVARLLRQATGTDNRNALTPFLAVIDEIVEMTPRVIEVRLKRPRPDLLKLFAQPELAVRQPGGGSGPLRIVPDRNGGVLLRPAPDLTQLPEDGRQPSAGSGVRLRGERAALAIARYTMGRADLVLGGSFADWPLLAAAKVPDDVVKIDPAAGLFGFAIVSRQGFLADAENRAALAMAIDRAALTAAFREDWAPAETLLPAQLDSAATPAAPIWSILPPQARREAARARVRAWRRPVAIRIALPSSSGGNLVWNAVARSLAGIGIIPRRVRTGEAAELELIDAVASYDSGRWYLVNACRLCGGRALALIEAARDAATLEERAQRIAEADAALAADSAFIAIAQPLRWSIVTESVPEWRGNARAWHPLNHLRNDPR